LCVIGDTQQLSRYSQQPWESQYFWSASASFTHHFDYLLFLQNSNRSHSACLWNLGQLDKIRLQKLLFLFTLKQTKTEYDFVPYKYGCYSYSANADLTTMVSKGQLAESQKHFVKLDKTDYLKLVKSEDLKYLQQVKTEYGKMSANTLMKHTYINYPFYATS
jgi:uncharacterized protein YwgA